VLGTRQKHDQVSAAASSAAPILSLPQLKSKLLDPSYPSCQFRRHAWDLLKELYLPRAHSPFFNRTTPYSWLQAACGLRGRSDALDHSLLAFCAIQISLAAIPSKTVDQDLELYNNGLQELIKELEDDRLRNNDETLAAIVVLSTCEV
jgi:hypothetical protein